MAVVYVKTVVDHPNNLRLTERPNDNVGVSAHDSAVPLVINDANARTLQTETITSQTHIRPDRRSRDNDSPTDDVELAHRRKSKTNSTEQNGVREKQKDNGEDLLKPKAAVVRTKDESCNDVALKPKILSKEEVEEHGQEWQAGILKTFYNIVIGEVIKKRGDIKDCHKNVYVAIP
eukprot:UN31194